MADERAGLTREDCAFYHSVVLNSGEVIDGAWDLRGGEQAYLGGTKVSGQRVLELGPATGYLTYYMERKGAEVVGLDVGFDIAVDLLPFAGQDPREARLGTMSYISMVQNSWWYLHRHFRSSAKSVYANIYSLPGDLGTFDLSLFGCILLHLRDPWTAIAQAARLTKKRIIVTDLIQDNQEPPEANVMRFAPLGPTELTNWWSIYPGAVVAMLKRLGFSTTTTTFHTQRHHLGHQMDAPPVDMSLFTVVADRD